MLRPLPTPASAPVVLLALCPPGKPEDRQGRKLVTESDTKLPVAEWTLVAWTPR